MVDEQTRAVQIQDLRRTKRSLEFFAKLLETVTTQGIETAKQAVDSEAWTREFIATIDAQLAELERPVATAQRKGKKAVEAVPLAPDEVA